MGNSLRLNAGRQWQICAGEIVTYPRQNKELPKPLENFARGLMATTCLTAACGASAVASTITEGTPPAPPVFPNSAPGYALPLGTTQVNGFIPGSSGEGGVGPPAFFEFQGLTPGGSYTLSGYTPASEDGLELQFGPDSNRTQFFLDIGEAGGGEAGAGPLTQAFTGPADGNVVVEVLQCCGNSPEAFFSVGLVNNTTTPEPTTIAGVGLGLGAIALAWRRRRVR
jgi:hypothetical protein